jgi:peroxiredoxin
MKSKNLIAVTILSFLIPLLFSCQPVKEKEELTIGKWRGEFTIDHHPVPFNFIVEDDTAGTIKAFLVNADERFALDSIRYENDSVVIAIDVYDTELRAKVRKDSLIGYFKKHQATGKGVPFRAVKNQDFRFNVSDNRQSSAKPDGTWSVFLESQKGKRYVVGKFNQQGKKVTGTFLTTTGDYRYLDGVVDGDSLKLSAFSGSNPTLLVAKFSDSIHFVGEYFSPSGKSTITAIKSDTAKLPDPYTLTYLKSKTEPFQFSFPDLNGKTVSLSDEKYKGKAVIVTILGSWCPNCLDEAAFLSPWYKENKKRGVEIIGLSFERKDDPAFAKARLDKFIKRFDIQYDILFAGIADKAEASKKLPSLNAVLSFPTTLFIDPSGKVSKIHTGFNGPATGELYKQFIKEFNADVDAILPKPTI